MKNERETVDIMKNLIIEILTEQYIKSGLTKEEYSKHPDSVGMTKDELYKEVKKRMNDLENDILN